MPRDAFAELLAIKRDQLKLAELAKPYIDGEQWAVTAVAALRNEIASLELQYLPRAERYTELTPLQRQEAWRRRARPIGAIG